MKILLIGSGGREHALAWKLAQSSHCSQLWCAPGNAGIAAELLSKNGHSVSCVPIAADNIDALLSLAHQIKPDLTVVGPDNPLGLGIVDRFQAQGFRIWGPNQRAAQFESSKAFSQAFMQRHGIPTARAGVFTDIASAKHFAESLNGRCAVKADGLALGKGVIICTSNSEAAQALDEIIVRRSYGAAGDTVVIQELLEGPEVSVHALCDGKTALLFPTSQDHKRALDNDEGLNTGGMGAYSPTPFLNDSQIEIVQTRILNPWLSGCAAERIDFRGILYPGIMLTADGPKVLEFNARFGNPETQVYVTRLENDLVELLEASVSGNLSQTALRWSDTASVCVVMASGGYPGNYEKGKPVRGLDVSAKLAQTKVFHAGTARAGDDIVTNGGRVLGVTAWAKTLSDARSKAYAAADQIKFEGAFFRRDIASKGLRR